MVGLRKKEILEENVFDIRMAIKDLRKTKISLNTYCVPNSMQGALPTAYNTGTKHYFEKVENPTKNKLW